MPNSDTNAAPTATYAAFAEATPGARFSDWLRTRAEPNWSAAVDHRFTVELAEDRISDAVYRRYLIQDYAFIETLVGIVGFAVGRAPSMDQKLNFAGFLNALTGTRTAISGAPSTPLMSPPETANHRSWAR